MARVAILDVDGTLVDTNYHHALAWYRALRQHDVRVPVWRIHRHIGMGGDQMVAALAGDEVENELGDDIRSAEKALYLAMIDEVATMPAARELIDELAGSGWAVVLASSAKQQEIDHYLDMLEVRDAVEGWTSSADVEKTKPHPDLIEAAMDLVGDRDAVMVGDSTWDCEAAARADVPSVAVLTGGFSERELRDAGASTVFETLQALCANLRDTPLAGAGDGDAGTAAS
jgi:HAD superfamily hydrolase (TIGR01549 family)